jgi:hypothetical protein
LVAACTNSQADFGLIFHLVRSFDRQHARSSGKLRLGRLDS